MSIASMRTTPQVSGLGPVTVYIARFKCRAYLFLLGSAHQKVAPGRARSTRLHCPLDLWQCKRGYCLQTNNVSMAAEYVCYSLTSQFFLFLRQPIQKDGLLRQPIACYEITKWTYDFVMTYVGNRAINMTLVMLFLIPVPRRETGFVGLWSRDRRV